jgi:uncharacterized protein (TIGR00269 family)
MRCSRCSENAVISAPCLCRKHFLKRFEEKVAATIRDFKLLRKGEKVVVASSGGKDSTATLFLLERLGYNVTALAIDEGIKGYRGKTLSNLKRFCKKSHIPIKIISFKDKSSYGETLDAILSDNSSLHPCTVCGTFRRQLLNRYAKGFDVIATGHNADDEAQSVLMNLCRANLDLFPRGGPMTTSHEKGFVRRVKPLYFCTEKEVMLYAVLNSLTLTFSECPYAHLSYRASVRDLLNEYEAKHVGAKVKILQHYLTVKRTFSLQKLTTIPCVCCGEPSATGLCKACRLIESLVEKNKVSI